MRCIFRYFLLVVMAVMSATTLAKTPVMHQVELIIFENTATKDAQQELWPETPPLPKVTNAVELSPYNPAQPASFQALPDTDYALNNVVLKLADDPNYRVLFHLAWQQTITEEAPTPVHISAPTTAIDDPNTTENPTPVWKIDGTVSLNKTKYYGVKTNLLLEKPLSHDPLGPIKHTRPTDTKRLYTLKQNRRLRVGKILYLDHPAFGVLIRITPQKTKQPSPTTQSAKTRTEHS